MQILHVSILATSNQVQLSFSYIMVPSMFHTYHDAGKNVHAMTSELHNLQINS